MAALALIRHGAYEQLPNTPSALQPYPLTPDGMVQVACEARAFGQWLEQSGYQPEPEIHCSTLLRAWQTAGIYARELARFFPDGPQLRSFPALCERSVGAVANLSTDEIERIVDQDPRFESLPPGWKSASDFRLPFDGAESLLEAGERVAGHLRTLPAFSADRRVQLVIGHGASLRHASYHLNVIEFSDISRLSMFYGHPVVIEKQNRNWVRLYGNWKRRPTANDPID